MTTNQNSFVGWMFFNAGSHTCRSGRYERTTVFIASYWTALYSGGAQGELAYLCFTLID